MQISKMRHTAVMGLALAMAITLVGCGQQGGQDKKGDIVVAKSAAKEDDLMNIVLENGGDDLKDDGDSWEVLTDPHAFEAVVEAIKKAGITPESAEIGMVPQNYVKLAGANANTMIRLIEAMDDHDDVQHVWSNFDMDIKELEEVAG